MSNGFLVCRGHCHRLLHERRWTVTGDAKYGLPTAKDEEEGAAA